MSSIQSKIRESRDRLKQLHTDYTLELMSVLQRYTRIQVPDQQQTPAFPRPMYSPPIPDRRIPYRVNISPDGPAPKRLEWSETETRTLMDMFQEGVPVREIARALPGRTEQAVHSKLKTLRREGSMRP